MPINKLLVYRVAGLLSATGATVAVIAFTAPTTNITRTGYSQAPAQHAAVGQSKTAVPDQVEPVPERDPFAPLAVIASRQDCKGCPDMVAIPGGGFVMGAPDNEVGRFSFEGPQRVVKVASFQIAVTEVTRGQFADFVADTGYRVDGPCYGWKGAELGKFTELSWKEPGFYQDDKHPVVCVGRNDARAYAEWLSEKTGKRYRLPSEAEWEYAARGRTTLARYWDGEDKTACEFANLADASFKRRLPVDPGWASLACVDYAAWTAPVGSYKPNAFGLHDMIGNVWEWVEDCWHDTLDGRPADGRAWMAQNCTLSVMRGGGWGDSMLQTARAASRANTAFVQRSVYTGFRVAADAEPVTPAPAPVTPVPTLHTAR